MHVFDRFFEIVISEAAASVPYEEMILTLIAKQMIAELQLTHSSWQGTFSSWMHSDAYFINDLVSQSYPDEGSIDWRNLLLDHYAYFEILLIKLLIIFCCPNIKAINNDSVE